MVSCGSFRLFICEAVHISTAWIFVRYIWRIKRERIACIGILMDIVAVILPVGRNRKCVEVIRVIPFIIKSFLTIKDAVEITEFPIAVQ